MKNILHNNQNIFNNKETYIDHVHKYYEHIFSKYDKSFDYELYIQEQLKTTAQINKTQFVKYIFKNNKLIVDNHLYLPTKVQLRAIITSTDVLHC